MRCHAVGHDGAVEGTGTSNAVGPAARGEVAGHVWTRDAAACGVTIGTFRPCGGVLRQLG
jgi:hypothetical protein